MNTVIFEQSPGCLVSQQATSGLIEELQELEDAYAECLADNVDAQTLASLWTRIKTLKRAISLNW